ncbi:tail fiber assembly protein [Serratia quinivorans]|uniref:tail fiber assembly protein n=1 Tax=Serratia quinivorans TaxID=137545 RepID=UPI0034C6663D
MMTTYKFSATTTSFYPAEMLDDYRKAGTLPDDLVSVDNEAYNTFVLSPPEGKIRGADKSGRPAWVEAPQPTKEQSIMMAITRKHLQAEKAEAVIAPLSRAVKFGEATQDETTNLIAWERYSVQLSRIKPEDAPDIDWPQPPQ